MLTRDEADELRRKVSAYREAWESYVEAVAHGWPSLHGRGALAEQAGEDLARLIRRLE